MSQQPTDHVEPASIGCEFPALCKKCKKEVDNTTLSLARSETGWKSRGIVDKAIANPAAHRRMAGKYMLDVFGGPGNVAKA